MTPYYDEDGIRIVVGDVREVLPQLEAGSADMFFTDPPYGHTENGSLQQRREAAMGWKDGVGVYRDDNAYGALVANDGAEANSLVQWFYGEASRLLKAGHVLCCCCCGGGGPDPQFARWSLWLDDVLQFKQMVVWDKGPMGMGWHYRRSYETVLVAEKPGAKCAWYDETDKVENIIRHIPKIIPSAKDHPTPKPVELAAHFIQLHTKPGDLVLDPFMGGGSTAEACKRLGRRFLGVEIDEQWAKLAIPRLAQSVLPIGVDGGDEEGR